MYHLSGTVQIELCSIWTVRVSCFWSNAKKAFDQKQELKFRFKWRKRKKKSTIWRLLLGWILVLILAWNGFQGIVLKEKSVDLRLKIEISLALCDS